MLNYWNDFVIELHWGIGYIITTVMQVCALIVLLRDFPRSVRGALMAFCECIISLAFYLVLTSTYYATIGIWQIGNVCMGVFALLYALLRSSYPRHVTAVRTCIYLAGAVTMMPISEPVGHLISQINENYFVWAQYLTPAIIGLLLAAQVAFLRKYSMDPHMPLNYRYVWIQLIFSLSAIGIEVYATASGLAQAERLYNVLVCACLWSVNLMTYYLFYSIQRGTAELLQARALQQKSELEMEKYRATRLNYDELRTIRHEIKNHNFYIKALLDTGKISEAQDYLERVTARGTAYLKSFDSGNYVVDVVMNHELAYAREQGVAVQTDVLVPRTLPFREEDLCSLLTNLLDNAIEAAAHAEVENPEVTLSMLPRQEYLFIRVTNPVSANLPARRRLSLETTKTEHSELHGYGTRIIKRIAQQYAGSVKYSMDNGIFTTSVMLEMPEEVHAA